MKRRGDEKVLWALTGRLSLIILLQPTNEPLHLKEGEHKKA
jgi:hypothetical protein